MQGLDPLDGEQGHDTVFRDVIFLALAGFVAVVLLLLPHLHPPKEAEAAIRSPGNVIVEIRWPDELDADIDLWVEAPGDVPVGYSNKGGTIFNLLRDDLGQRGDTTALNYEISYSRGVPAGEYTVNVHLYRNSGGYASIPVTVSVSVKAKTNESARRLLATKLRLDHEGEERTAFRFSLDREGRLLRESVHDLPKPLRSG
ncbi:MAG: hypothetical protein R3285_01310 [Kiloniellales bacterium]|nr:hypothetical protein [Kiloniellales bacterium]